MDEHMLPTSELLEQLESVQATSPLNLSEDALTALYTMGYNLYQQGKYTDAKQFFHLLTLIDSLDRRYWMGLAACHQKLKNYLQAIEYYSVVALQDIENPYVHFHAAECYFGACQPDKGLEALESAVEVAGMSPAHESLLAQLKLMQASWSGKHNKEVSKGVI